MLNPALSFKINKYLPIAILFFFFNSFLLPHGLLYTALLTPFLYLWSFIHGRRMMLLSFLLLFTPFIIVHFIIGVNAKEYIVSLALAFTVWVLGFSAYTFLQRVHNLDRIFNTLAILNLILTAIAILAFFTPLRPAFWYINNLTKDFNDFPRLALFTYEASYYSTLLAPLVFYFFLKMILQKKRRSIQNFFILIIPPLILSFSLGVITAILISIVTVFFIYPKIFLLKKSMLTATFVLLIIIILGILFLLIFYPDNPLFYRVMNIILGLDPSAKGRTTEAFKIGYSVADIRSLWWGIGFGQLQLVATEYIYAYYNYTAEWMPTVRIPNAIAETLAVFGFIGLFLRLCAQIFFFFKTRVWDNYFRLMLFIFMFIFQFAGSFITSVIELLIWIMAFTPIFPQFDRSKKAQE